MLIGKYALPHIIERHLGGHFHLVGPEKSHKAAVHVKLQKSAVTALGQHIASSVDIQPYLCG